jgi:CheY-like chemotaxis protein/two-component sensor histidine kinase
MTYAGQEAEVLELVDVSRIVEEMIELLKVAVSKHATVKARLARDLPAVRANSSQLRQVVMNLITNASEAIGDRDGAIVVTTGQVTASRESPAASRERLPEGNYVQLQVSDTGCGMTPEIQAKVFDPFFTTRQAGHGLGLSVVQGVVRSLHGSIHLVSAPGGGTTFEILLPCVADVPTATHHAPRAPELKLLPREATVLVVEDEDSLRRPVSMTLRKAGITILEANDGHTALDQLRAHKGRIDILFLDVSLPGVPSRQLFEEARLLIPNAAVIITSAYSRENAAAALSAPVPYFIRKPYRINDLMNLIRETLH